MGFSRQEYWSGAPSPFPVVCGDLNKKEEELKRLLMKGEEESEEVGLKLNIQKPRIMGSGPITSWEIDGETMGTVSDFIFWAPKSL